MASTYCTPGSATYSNINSPIYCFLSDVLPTVGVFVGLIVLGLFVASLVSAASRGGGFSVNGHVLERRRAFVKRWQEYFAPRGRLQGRMGGL